MDKKMQEKTVNTQPQTRKPDENGSIHVQGHVKIHDPETKEVFVNGRA